MRSLIGAVLLPGVLRSLYAEQKAPPPPPLPAQDEAQPHPLLHQLQTGCSQVGGRRASARVSSESVPFRQIWFLRRLYLLVQLFGDVQAAEFSSRLSPAGRRNTLKDFQQGHIQL